MYSNKFKKMKTTVQIQNLKCGGCKATIVSELSKLDSIKNVSVNIEDATVSLEYETENELSTIKSKLSKLGYPTVDENNSLLKKAKSYASCAVGRLK